MAGRGGWASQLTPGAEDGPAVRRGPGAPALVSAWCRGGEPRQGVAVPGEPCWRWIHFHRLFLLFGWIHLHWLHTISRMSDGHRYHAADGASPLTAPPLPPRLLQPPLFPPAQRWTATRLAAMWPLCTNHRWHERTPRSSANCGPGAGVPVLIGPGTEGSEVACDIRRPL